MSSRYTTQGSTYDGAELKTRSSRPGAYDAFAIPSLMFGKTDRQPAAEPEPLPSPLPTASTALPLQLQQATKGTHGAYRPLPGSVGDQVLSHLRKHGGTLTTKQIMDLCGVERESVSGLMQRARATGAVKHEIRDKRGYYSLPDAEDAAEAPAPAPAPAPEATPLPSAPPVAAAADRQAQALQDMAASVEAINKALEQLQAQAHYIACAIHKALTSLPELTTPHALQA